MPRAFPHYVLPDPPALVDESLRDVMVGWWRAVNDVWLQTLKYVELFPVETLAVSTAALTLTTARQNIPGLAATVTVPPGGVINITTFLDMECDTAAIAAIGELHVRQPDGSTSVEARQVLNVPGNGAGTIRGTFGNQWQFRNPTPGGWAFQMLGRKSTNTGVATIPADHNSMAISVR